jgi:hypothetical protein
LPGDHRHNDAPCHSLFLWCYPGRPPKRRTRADIAGRASSGPAQNSDGLLRGGSEGPFTCPRSCEYRCRV